MGAGQSANSMGVSSNGSDNLNRSRIKKVDFKSRSSNISLDSTGRSQLINRTLAECPEKEIKLWDKTCHKFGYKVPVIRACPACSTLLEDLSSSKYMECLSCHHLFCSICLLSRGEKGWTCGTSFDYCGSTARRQIINVPEDNMRDNMPVQNIPAQNPRQSNSSETKIVIELANRQTIKTKIPKGMTGQQIKKYIYIVLSSDIEPPQMTLYYSNIELKNQATLSSLESNQSKTIHLTQKMLGQAHQKPISKRPRQPRQEKISKVYLDEKDIQFHDDRVEKMSCGCQMSQQQMKSYIQQQVKKRNSQITCPKHSKVRWQWQKCIKVAKLTQNETEVLSRRLRKIESAKKSHDKLNSVLKTCPDKMLMFQSKEYPIPSLRACPKCKDLIEHSLYSKHILCNKCQNQFCFVCLSQKPTGKDFPCGEPFKFCGKIHLRQQF